MAVLEREWNDLARNPGLSNKTEYGAGEFPLPTRPPAGFAAQPTIKPLSMIRSQQLEEGTKEGSEGAGQIELLIGMAGNLRGTRRTMKKIKRSSRGIRQGAI